MMKEFVNVVPLKWIPTKLRNEKKKDVFISSSKNL